MFYYYYRWWFCTKLDSLFSMPAPQSLSLFSHIYLYFRAVHIIIIWQWFGNSIYVQSQFQMRQIYFLVEYFGFHSFQQFLFQIINLSIKITASKATAQHARVLIVYIIYLFHFGQQFSNGTDLHFVWNAQKWFCFVSCSLFERENACGGWWIPYWVRYRPIQFCDFFVLQPV